LELTLRLVRMHACCCVTVVMPYFDSLLFFRFLD
jgi:hypothetical protein